ncbi:MAG: hypothetical protein LW832_00730 [Parachlamydia sp.]|nr:hypothetical protein [Parachlamydia sp.]
MVLFLGNGIIKNRVKKTHIAPLPCLKRILSDRIWSHYDEIGILNLSQETLDADLVQLEQEVILKYPRKQTELAKMFFMVKEMMLRVDPSERKTIAECLDFLQQFPPQVA